MAQFGQALEHDAVGFGIDELEAERLRDGGLRELSADDAFKKGEAIVRHQCLRADQSVMRRRHVKVSRLLVAG